MRKKLVSLGFALAALAAASAFTSSAANGQNCPPGNRVVLCADGVHHICCPDNAFCAC